MTLFESAVIAIFPTLVMIYLFRRTDTTIREDMTAFSAAMVYWIAFIMIVKFLSGFIS